MLPFLAPSFVVVFSFVLNKMFSHIPSDPQFLVVLPLFYMPLALELNWI